MREALSERERVRERECMCVGEMGEIRERGNGIDRVHICSVRLDS